MRCFIAVELDEPVLRPLTRVLAERLPRGRGVRWCTEKQLHVTLKFLGDLEETAVPDLRAAMEQASREVQPFEITLNAYGVFPRPNNPRVFWCGVDDPAEGCRQWVTQADPLLEAIGFEPEQREFTPHITLGRANSPAGSKLMRDLLTTLPKPGSPAMTVTHVTLFESRLKPEGAEYRALHSASLGG